MNKERKNDDVWNAERILCGYIYYTDKEGCLPNLDNLIDSSYKIGLQRLYSALRAYGREPEWFYRNEGFGNDNRSKYCILLSKTRSQEKINEFRNLVKKHLRQNLRYDFVAQSMDIPDYLKSEMDVFVVFGKLMEYGKKLQAISDIWSGMMECSLCIGTIYHFTEDLTYEYIVPMRQIIDRMIILLMGDDYDKSFTAEELYHYGYPHVTDEKLYRLMNEEL